MPNVVRHLFYYLPTLITLLAICYLSLTPDPLPHNQGFFQFTGSDKVVHCVMYMALTFTFCYDHSRHQRRAISDNMVWIYIALAMAVAIGGIIEILQAQMALGRSGDILDFAADAVGASIGILIGIKFFK